jgi:flagellum-specific peptidoglycan hydrolase FlgJ
MKLLLKKIQHKYGLMRHAYEQWKESHKHLLSFGKIVTISAMTLVVSSMVADGGGTSIAASIVPDSIAEREELKRQQAKVKATVKQKDEAKKHEKDKRMTPEQRKAMLKQFGSRKAWLDPKGAAVENARVIERVNGVPMWLTLAQGMMESVGKNELSEIGTKNYNLFGHKPHSGKHGLEGTGQKVQDKRGLDGTNLDHQRYTSFFWSFFHHGRIVKKNFLSGVDATKLSVTEVIDCMCPESNLGKGYDYAEACGGKDKNGNYHKTKVHKGKTIATYEWTMQEFVERYDLLDIR